MEETNMDYNNKLGKIENECFKIRYQCEATLFKQIVQLFIPVK